MPECTDPERAFLNSLKAAWEEYREELVADLIADHGDVDPNEDLVQLFLDDSTFDAGGLELEDEIEPIVRAWEENLDDK